jgi:hypothetical protein
VRKFVLRLEACIDLGGGKSALYFLMRMILYTTIINPAIYASANRLQMPRAPSEMPRETKYVQFRCPTTVQQVDEGFFPAYNDA